MSETVIQARGLGKKYQLGTIGYGTLRHDLQAWWARMRGREDPNAQIGGKSRLDLHGDFWALRDVNFDVEHGDRVGIIGRNGAGKSTLLRILSQITRPTEGVVRMKGRVASLLEVGTGFHPELTGRENIFLNGAIMGMKRREIQRKFDEIVSFAEVEQFIDTPVKRYSSGMYVRLGFAVAAHLEPDILVVDEVLAVGDAAFQKRCLGKMEDVSREGRTVLFVSHSMQSISYLCRKAIWLENGSIVEVGNSSSVIESYLKATNLAYDRPAAGRTDREGTGRLQFTNVVVDTSSIDQDELLIDLYIANRTGTPVDKLLVSVVLEDETGRSVTNMVNYNAGRLHCAAADRETHLRLHVQDLNLVEGRYFVNVFISSDTRNTEIFDWVKHAASFMIPQRDYYRSGYAPIMKGSSVMYLRFRYEDDMTVAI